MKYKKPYEEQFNRIVRLRKNLDAYTKITDGNFEEAVDKCTSFFIQCYHLRDWLIKSGVSKSAVDSFVRGKLCLSLCRDMANKQKHQSIDRYKPDNSFVDFQVGVSTPISRFRDPLKQVSKLGVDVWEYGYPLDVLDVADQCIKDWSNFIESHQERMQNS